jgi:protein-tyrosine phosphatase
VQRGNPATPGGRATPARKVDSLAVPTDSPRSLAHGARHLGDRLLHRWRRRRIVRGLTRRPPPTAVLFVCSGNICRSPFAAAVARQVLPKEIGIASAGFVGPDRPAPPEAVAAAAEHGLDLSSHRSELITPERLRSAGLVVVMEKEHRRRVVDLRRSLLDRVVLLGDLDPMPISERTVTDPLNQPLETFRSTYDRIDRCVRALAALWDERGGSEPRG